MAQTVTTTIEINGVKINHFTTLKLSQGIYAHHTFRLVCPLEAVEGGEGVIFKDSKGLIGVPIQIHVVSEQDRSELHFVGVVTQMEATCHNGHAGNVVISGYSPTILLDNNPHCRSWLRKPIKNMVKDVLEMHPDDILKFRLSPTYKETIYYTVQYKETAWQFINRLAGKHGEWLFYDGQMLVLGAPKGKKFKLTYGLQLSRFAVHMQLKPGKFQVMAFDYVDNQIHRREMVHSALNGGHNELGEYVISKGEQLFGGPAINWHNHFVRSKKQFDDTVNFRAACEISDVVQLNGCSDLPGFQPGDCVSINADKAKFADNQSLGNYAIISVEHSWDGIGNYSNEFVAVPATVKVPPVKPLAEPICETQSALVVDNRDEAGLGRVQVRFHWMGEKEKSPLLRVVSPYAGNGKGMFMLPEKGEEVIVSFAGGKATRPYVVGTVYNGGAKSEYGAVAGNHIKAIQTRSGIKVIMDDSEGSVLMQDKSGNQLKMDGDKSILIKANGSLKLTCGEAELEMKDGEITISGKKISIKTTEDLNIECNEKANINAGVDLSMQAGVIRLN
ncbi:type VI secretion system Vgr family protein [Niastella sp. OAS944]|uniref:type VI secretion system Vgr family protein n=1 Tax=Niastella sp. OAS944 TaxID=2664089 RepID=UPI00346EA602|nr:Rhs element Vgr protein [Chitinophagaceae bacterium OAS944]